MHDPVTQPPVVHCQVCEETFISMRDLNVHTAVNHGHHTGITDGTMTEYCSLCDTSFMSKRFLLNHLAHQHNISSYYTCELCEKIYPTYQCLKKHLETNYNVVDLFPCLICDKVLINKKELALHIQSAHESHCTLHCDPSNESLASQSDLSSHTEMDHTDLEMLSPIQQVDGNVSLLDDSTATVTLPEPISRRYSHTSDLTYNYTLNSNNQSRRMLQNALKPPIAITYNNLQSINNVNHALNAIVECSSGVYLTAIKPALMEVTDTWSANVANHVITCSNVSDRNDNNKRHLVCTQLTLHVKPKVMQGEDNIHNLTLHFYHTKDKVLIQSSTVMSPGMSAAKWLVKFFIEPLADNHIATNQQTIEQVNNAIISSVTSRGFSCSFCTRTIDPAAPQVKDLPLTCDKCKRMCHKKCSDRSGDRGSKWNKKPWLCPSCSQSSILSLAPALPPSQQQQDGQVSNQAPDQAQHVPALRQRLTDADLPSPPGTNTILMVTFSTPGRQSASPSAEDDSITCITGLGPHQPSHNLNPSAQEYNPSFSSTLAKGLTTTSTSQPRKFPNNSIRQRNSNVATTNPEIEFLKTSLDACRSTIVQQEADIKRLNENIDLRNKRIMQLEGQVGVATTYLTSSSASVSPSSQEHLPVIIEQLKKITESLHVQMAKFSALPDLLGKTQTVNVYNNHQKPLTNEKVSQTPPVLPDYKPAKHNTGNVTDDPLTDNGMAGLGSDSDQLNSNLETILTCTLCNITLQSDSELNLHLETRHKSMSEINCEFCSETFPSTQKYEQHISSKHVTEYLGCKMCKLRFSSRSKLNEHLQASHISSTQPLDILRPLKPVPVQQSSTSPSPGAKAL